MLVKEMIAELNKFDPDAYVCVQGGYNVSVVDWQNQGEAHITAEDA